MNRNYCASYEIKKNVENELGKNKNVFLRKKKSL